MDTAWDKVQEELLGDIIARGSDDICSLFLNETDGLEAADYDGSGDRMPVQEWDRDDGSSDRTESGQVHILVKLLLTS